MRNGLLPSCGLDNYAGLLPKSPPVWLFENKELPPAGGFESLLPKRLELASPVKPSFLELSFKVPNKPPPLGNFLAAAELLLLPKSELPVIGGGLGSELLAEIECFGSLFWAV